MIRFAIVGSGWRSLFYVRIAKALPEKFELVALLCRSQEKAYKLAEEYGIHTTINEAEILELAPDFIVSTVNKAAMSEVSVYWAKKGIPVLSETPAAMDLQTLRDLYQEVNKGLKIQVAEQYFLYPSYKAAISVMASGLLGEPVSLHLSAMHDYHAVSVIRHMLQTGLEDVAVTGKILSTKVTDTKTRYAVLTEGKVVNRQEKHLIMEYESGKTAFYDFMSDQYRSEIRNTYFNLRGTRGEIINDMVYYLNEDNIACKKPLKIVNPYSGLGLSEDEAAIAEVMIGMKEYVETGKEIYPMKEALYDAYTTLLMDEAGAKAYETVKGSFADIK